MCEENVKATTCCPADGYWEMNEIVQDIDIIQKYLDNIKTLINNNYKENLQNFENLAKVRYYYNRIEGASARCKHNTEYLEGIFIENQLFNNED